MQIFTEYKIITTPFVPDLISGALWSLTIDGITEEEDYIAVFAKEHTVSRSEIENLLNKFIAEGIIEAFEITEQKLENKNWNEEWEKTINVIKVTDKIVIKPTFREYIPEEGQLVLTIDPKMSFGTGEHQTTRLMLMMIEKHMQPGTTVLDAGTGTGVLAIAAVKLGASSAIAFDNDEWCYDNAIENCKLNSVDNKVKFRLAEIDDIKESNFDFVLANINKYILIEICSKLVEKVKCGGTLILSGLLHTDESDILKIYSGELNLQDRLQMDEWISLLFTKK